MFQPHRYTRTQALFSQFVTALSMADQLLLLDIYPAGEIAVEGISSAALLQQIHQENPAARLVTESTLREVLEGLITDGNVILMQGAGSVGQMAQNLMQPQQVSA